MFSLSGVTTRAVIFAIIPALFFVPAFASRRSHGQARPGKSKLLSKSQMIAAAKTLSRKAKREERAAAAKLESHRKAKAAAEKAELAQQETPKVLKSQKVTTAVVETERPALAKSFIGESSSARLKVVESPAAEISKSSKLSTQVKVTPADKGVDLEAPTGLRNVSQVATREQMNASVAKALQPDSAVPGSSVTDVIEVIEYDSPENRKLDDIYREDVKRPVVSTVPNVSKKRVDLTRMDSDRITQIQDALVRKNYLTGTPTGVYDGATEEAMRRFQADHKVDVTGFPTAQSLKLLGLMDWR